MMQDLTNIGEKAKNLIKLKEGFPSLVPRFEIINLNNLFINWEETSSKLHGLSANYINKKISAEKYKHETNVVFDLVKFNNNYVNQLAKNLHNLNFYKVSYRTSALQEDLESSSFAGQYITFLNKNINKEEIKKYCKECAKSLFSLRVLEYIGVRGHREFKQGGSIIIQEMFYGKVSGVLFTENGLNQLEFAYTTSWKNTTVDGSPADNLAINKSSKDFKKDLPKNLPQTLLSVISAALSLEKQLGVPLDIEWAITNDRAALLQFRPITTHKLDYEIEWDNTNIAESYPGITLPLTYTFIRRLYSKVYPEFLKLLGKSRSELSENTHVFNNMLGYINGRVYYNINNWYKLVALLPGYRYNKDFFEAMLMPAKKQVAQKTQKKKASLGSKLNFGIIALRFVWLLLQTNKLSDKFTKNYLKSYNSYKTVQWNQLTTIGILNTYSEIEKDLLQQWAVPILNDFRTMVFHGILKKIFFTRINNDLYIQLLSGIYDHTSVEPVRELGVLAEHVKVILEKYNKDKEKTAKAILNANDYQETRDLIEKYLLKYGERSPDELKLENPRLSESFPAFVNFVVSSAEGYAINNKVNNKTAQQVNNNTTNNVLTDKIFANNILLKPLFNFVLHQAKSGISKRERFRFYRAQVYGLARDAYLAIGNRFVDAKLINSRDDIFYLTTQEIQDVILGHSFEFSLKAKVSSRKKLFANFRNKNLGRRATSSGVVAPLNTAADNIGNNSNTNQMTGLGVSKGLFRGEVVVVREFDPKVNVRGKVLVTEHTDPGWTLLFLNASALIVERGNALSHASIVAREIGIPAVVGVESACSKLKKGQKVIVNGSSGEVTIL